jgi:phage tail P2-like protein
MSNNNQISLLPINASNFLKDLEQIGNKTLDLETANNLVCNPDKAPENILPWLAWALSVDDWSDNWPEEIRRNVIKASVEIHRHKGTIGALKRALQAFNCSNIKIEEWFDYGANPYYFRVSFDVVEPEFDVNIIAEVQKVIESTKNTRSHLEILKASLSAKTGLMYIGSVIIAKEVTFLSPVIYGFGDMAGKSS